MRSGAKCANLVYLVNIFQTRIYNLHLFTCKIRLRYSREWASQSLQKISQKLAKSQKNSQKKHRKEPSPTCARAGRSMSRCSITRRIQKRRSITSTSLRRITYLGSRSQTIACDRKDHSEPHSHTEASLQICLWTRSRKWGKSEARKKALLRQLIGMVVQTIDQTIDQTIVQTIVQMILQPTPEPRCCELPIQLPPLFFIESRWSDRV